MLYVNGCSFSCSGGLNWEDVKSQYKTKLNIFLLLSNIVGVETEIISNNNFWSDILL